MSIPSLAGSHRAGYWQEFWATHIRLGYAVLAGESFAALLYFLLTPSGSHRPLLIAIACLSIAIAISVGAFASRIAARSWRIQLIFISTVLSGIVLTLCVHLDGGINSPLVYLTVLPVMSAALALPESQVTICGLAAAAEIVIVVSITDPHRASPAGKLLILSAFVLGTIVLSVVSARGRARLQAKETVTLDELSRLAETDALTGCLNHRAFYSRLASEVDRSLRYGHSLSMMMADVDLFKSFNDTHGHPAGDAALTAVGAVLKGVVRSSDIVARIGGDEFAVLLPAANLDHGSPGGYDSVLDLAERMTTAVRERSDIGITLSIGIATLDPAEPTAQRLVRDADTALYRAKANGRGGVATAASSPGDGAGRRPWPEFEREDRVRLEEQLRQARRETSETVSLLDVLQSSTPVGLGFVDRDFRMVRINQMLADVHGSSVNDQLGRTVAEVVPDLWPQLEPTYRKVLETGAPASIKEVMGETAADPGVPHYWLTSLYPIVVSGETAGIGIVVVDITDRKKLEESQNALTHTVVAALGATVEIRDPYTAGHQSASQRWPLPLLPRSVATPP